ncbi:hypothetical protein PINS_up019954 [Pythium insidiosum]|nr:hypothetical protein PINS_up019954 [Pythium insidiosum]
MTTRSPTAIDLALDKGATGSGLAVDGNRVQFDPTFTFTGATLQTPDPLSVWQRRSRCAVLARRAAAAAQLRGERLPRPR